MFDLLSFGAVLDVDALLPGKVIGKVGHLGIAFKSLSSRVLILL